MSEKILRGVAHGHVIELDRDTGITDGELVEVVLRPIERSDRRPGDGFLRSEGALADCPEWDAIMEEIQRERKIERRSSPDDE